MCFFSNIYWLYVFPIWHKQSMYVVNKVITCLKEIKLSMIREKFRPLKRSSLKKFRSRKSSKSFLPFNLFTRVCTGRLYVLVLNAQEVLSVFIQWASYENTRSIFQPKSLSLSHSLIHFLSHKVLQILSVNHCRRNKE